MKEGEAGKTGGKSWNVKRREKMNCVESTSIRKENVGHRKSRYRETRPNCRCRRERQRKAQRYKRATLTKEEEGKVVYTKGSEENGA